MELRGSAEKLRSTAVGTHTVRKHGPFCFEPSENIFRKVTRDGSRTERDSGQKRTNGPQRPTENDGLMSENAARTHDAHCGARRPQRVEGRENSCSDRPGAS